MINAIQQEARHFVSTLSTKDKLYIILLVAAIARSIFVFVNFDSNVYQIWLEYFIQTGELPYFDHPPLFFVVTASLEFIFSSLQSISPYIYWYLLIPTFYGLYRYTENKSPYLFALSGYILVYIGAIGYLGNIYEIAAIASMISGILFVYFTYLIGSLKDENIGLYAALFTSLAWWPIVYSNIVLIDMFASTLMMASYYLYYCLIKADSPSRSLYLTNFVILTLALYSKYYALTVGIFVAIYAFYVHKRDIETLLTRLSPAIASALVFGLWAIYTNFSFLSHYAATHYRFLVMPGALGFPNFFYKALTPLLLVAAIYGCIKIVKQDKDYSIYLLTPIAFGVTFHLIQTFVFRRSHSLINLTNYMLYIFPLIAVIAAEGWRSIIENSNKYLLTSLLVLTLGFHISGSSIQLEYDQDYKTPNLNVNTLSNSDFERLNITKNGYNTLHYNYQFQRELAIFSNPERRAAHFRWLSPKSIKIISTEPTRYKLDIISAKADSVTISNKGRERQIDVSEKENIYLLANENLENYRIDSSYEVPFVAKKTNCNLNPENCEAKKGALE